MQQIKKLFLLAIFSLGIYNNTYPWLSSEENNHLLEFIEELHSINQYKTEQIAEWLEFLTFYPTYRDRYNCGAFYGNNATNTLRYVLSIIDNSALTATSKIKFLNRFIKIDKEKYVEEKRIYKKNAGNGRWFLIPYILSISSSISFFAFLGFMMSINEQMKYQNKGF